MTEKEIFDSIKQRGYDVVVEYPGAYIRNSAWPAGCIVLLIIDYPEFKNPPKSDPFFTSVFGLEEAMAVLGQIERGFMFRYWSNLRTVAEARQKEKEVKV